MIIFRGGKSIKRKEKILLITGIFMLFIVGACSNKINPTGPGVNPTRTFTAITTPTITKTYTAAPTFTGTRTAVVSATSSATLVPTGTETMAPADTSTMTLTETPSASSTATLTVSQTISPTAVSTGTETITVTVSFTGTVTLTATLVQTLSNTPSPYFSPTVEPTATVTVSSTPFTGNIGSVILSPMSAYGQTAGNQLTFTYTAGDLTWASWPSWGTLRIKIPAGWSAPSLSSTAPGAFSVAVFGGVLYGRAVDGNDIIVKVRNLQPGTGTIIVVYGSMASGPGAYIDGSGMITIPVEVDDDGEITSELATSPVINILPATATITPTFTPIIGEGSVAVSPSQVVSGSCGLTMTFTYTAGKTAWAGSPGKGRLRIRLPAGWSAPSLTGTDPGYFEAASSSASWVGQLVEGQDMIIEARDLTAFTGQLIVTYGYKGAGGPGACITGNGLVTLLTETDVDGTDTYAIGISPQVLVVPPTATVTETSTITMTSSVTPTITETWTITQTHTITPTWTITETHTVSPTVTVTLTQTFTPTFTITPTSTATPTPYWKIVGYKGFSDSMAEEISLGVYLGTPYVCYRDASVTDRLTLMKFSGSWNAAGENGFSPGIAYEPSLFVYDGVPYVAFRDYNNNSNKASAMRYMDMTGWEYIGGTRNFTSAAAYGPSMFVYADLPYVAYQDSASSGKATVMFNNIGGWNNTGAAGFSSGTASSISQFIDVSTGSHYVAYRDWANSYKVTVKMFNGISWINVGTPGISAGGAEHISLFTPVGGQPYVAYMDTANSNKATVKHFNGTNWDTVGTAGFSAGRAEYVSLSVYGGTPSVAFRDGGNGDRAVVMKFNGVSWDLFAVVSDAGANYVRLFIDQSAGKPYVAFKDEYQGGKATVVTYEGSY